MKFRTTLLLVGVCVILGGYVIWSGRSTSASTANATATPTTHVLAFNTADVDTIAVHDTHGNTVEATRSDTTWTLTKPTAVAADSSLLGSTLDGLATLSATQVITPPSADLAPYGLATPAYVIQLRKGANVVGELHVGVKNPNGSATYVQPANAKVVYLDSDAAIQTVVSWLTAPPVQPTPLPTLPPLTPTAPITTTATP